ncbi:5' nucleotidase, NT5C type [Caryophanon tenue]|uniref:5'-3'-deoxyribonucleotidase n=1 Tax=Caryophanon tenue TaxID=33978 RepID=A0A1C0Y8P1_9BACL|nr:5'-3'-deoxyribonucleotidase [Caryophanon tenue]OCS83529.1 5'-3'-deoxyribonucleotidase [Caryophanon tenue]
MRKSIAVDMDQVLANFVDKAVSASNAHFNENLSAYEIFYGEHSEEKRKKFWQIINEPDFFRDLALLDEDAPIVLKELSEEYDIYIATAAMDVPGSFAAKYDWLRKHFPFLDPNYFIFCGNKKVVNADYLIDDNTQQLRNFTGQGILFDQPNNRSDEQFPRVLGWKGVREYFASIKAEA